MAGETSDQLRGYNLVLAQPASGYRFSLDPLLLAGFVGAGGSGRCLDLGTGSGILPLLLARRGWQGELLGVEFQPEMAALAERNARENGLVTQVRIIVADILDLGGEVAAGSCDLVVCNPPFRVRGSGRVSPHSGRDLARHESTATLGDFLAVARRLVRTRGRICFVHLAERLGEFLAAAATLQLVPLRLQLVHGSAQAGARMFLVELSKGRRGALHVLPPLLVHAADGSYTAEVAALLQPQGAGA